jgi:hypothetical protein
MPAFDPLSALEHASSLAFPRLVGSPGEARAARYIADRLRRSGLTVTEEPFGFSTRPWGLLRFALGVSAGTSLVAGWAVGRHPLLACLLSAFPLLLGLFSTPLTLRLLSGAVRDEAEVSGGKGLGRSLNLVARRPSDAPGKAPLVVMMAHYDSKGQGLSLPLRILLFLTFAIGGIGLFLRAVWQSGVTPDGLDPLAVGFGLLAALSALATVPMRADNRSPGAVDNAAGVGVLLGLAGAIGGDPGCLPGVEVLFVATGAEEVGLQGAFAFMKRHAEMLKGRRQVYVLNFDGPGVAGKVYASAKTGLRSRSRALLGRIREAGAAEGIRVHTPAFVIGAMADHFPFVHAGIEAVTLSAFGPDSLTIHTPRDTADRLDAEMMGRVGRIALEVIDRIERDTSK